MLFRLVKFARNLQRTAPEPMPGRTGFRSVGQVNTRVPDTGELADSERRIAKVAHRAGRRAGSKLPARSHHGCPRHGFSTVLVPGQLSCGPARPIAAAQSGKKTAGHRQGRLSRRAGFAPGWVSGAQR
jgi:hypothetical protein